MKYIPPYNTCPTNKTLYNRTNPPYSIRTVSSSPTDERLQAYHNSLAISMKNVQMSYIP